MPKTKPKPSRRTLKANQPSSGTHNAIFAAIPSPYGAIALPAEVIALLDEVAGKLGLTRDALAEMALLRALDDIEDEILADEGMKAWEADGFRTVSLADVLKDNGLEG